MILNSGWQWSPCYSVVVIDFFNGGSNLLQLWWRIVMSRRSSCCWRTPNLQTACGWPSNIGGSFTWICHFFGIQKKHLRRKPFTLTPQRHRLSNRWWTQMFGRGLWTGERVPQLVCLSHRLQINVHRGKVFVCANMHGLLRANLQPYPWFGSVNVHLPSFGEYSTIFHHRPSSLCNQMSMFVSP